jgi:hypothetical protein
MRMQSYLRGFKVSLSEVEAALMACEGVTAAAAAITEDFTGVQRLVVRASSVHTWHIRAQRAHMRAHVCWHGRAAPLML